MFKAVEDLGGGLKATAVFEQRFNGANAQDTTGDQYIDLAGSFGAIRAGQFNWNSHSGYNAFGSNTATALGTTSRQFASKLNNVASYTTPSFSGFTASVATVRDTSAGAVGKDATGLKVNYSNGPLAVQLANTSGVRALTSTAKTDTTALGVNYDFTVAKVFFNASQTKTSGAALKASGYSISVDVPVTTAITVRGGYMDNKNMTGATDVDRLSLGVQYAFSKRTSAVAELARDKQAETGLGKVTNHFVGLVHTF